MSGKLLHHVGPTFGFCLVLFSPNFSIEAADYCGSPQVSDVRISEQPFLATLNRNLYDSPQETDENAYRTWYETNAAKNLPKAFELAKNYLKDFPAGKYAEYLKKWVSNTRAKLFNEAVSAKNLDEILRLGNEELAAEPENLDYLLQLACQLIGMELNAKPPSYSHASQTADFSLRSIKLIEAGKKPVSVQQWNQNETLVYLYQIVGRVEEHNKNQDTALQYFEKAAKLDPANVTASFDSGRLYQVRYLSAAEKYRTIPETERSAADPSPQVKAALKEVDDAADAVLQHWIKFLKLTAVNNAYGSTREEVEKAVGELYKYRHPDAPDGYQALIKP